MSSSPEQVPTTNDTSTEAAAPKKTFFRQISSGSYWNWSSGGHSNKEDAKAAPATTDTTPRNFLRQISAGTDWSWGSNSAKDKKDLADEDDGSADFLKPLPNKSGTTPIATIEEDK